MGGGVRGKFIRNLDKQKNNSEKNKETPPKKAKQNKQKIIMVKLNFAKKSGE